MRKTMEQIVLEGQAQKCSSMEELFLLWQLMQQMEEDPMGNTCHPGIDPRSFHIDGILSPEQFGGVLYILKETNMKKYIREGQTMPVITDVRTSLRSGKSRTGEVEFLRHLSGMQEILEREQLGKGSLKKDEETAGKRVGEKAGEKASGLGDYPLNHAAVLYINKRGGTGGADEVSLNYGRYYIEWIGRQIRLMDPKVIVCCGEDIFRLIVMEVFRNKREKKNQEIYMKWKNLIEGDVFFADQAYRPVRTEQKAAVSVLRMWSPAYRVNNGRYVSLEEYLSEFERRVKAWKKS